MVPKVWQLRWLGSQTEFPNYKPEKYIIKEYDDGFAVTCDMEKSGKNEWGLYGVGGNLWEWTSEKHEVTDRKGQFGVWRRPRGASWIGGEKKDLLINMVHFSDNPETDRCRYKGFRVVILPGNSGGAGDAGAAPIAPVPSATNQLK